MFPALPVCAANLFLEAPTRNPRRILTVVKASDKHNANQMPFVPITSGSSKNDGIRINLDFNWSPYALNSALDGKANFYSITFNALGAKTLYSITDENWDWFSIQVLDRIFINWTSGSMIPVYAQNNGSLGRQVRGFADFSMNREFTVVNNFEFRFTGPMLGTKLLYPRLSLFVDVGYGMGRYYNTDWNPSGDFVASTGASISITLIDAIDLGVSAIYLIEGENYAKGPGSFVTEFFFFLDL